MVVTGEYATGSIRSTFAAVPRRLPVLWSKLGVFLATTLVLGTIASVLAFVAGQAIFSTKHVDASFGDPHVAARRPRLRALPGRDGRLRPRARRAAAQHRRRDHDAHARALRRARDRRRDAQGREDRPVPAVRGGADDHVGVGRAARSARGPASACCARTWSLRSPSPPSCWCAETRESPDPSPAARRPAAGAGPAGARRRGRARQRPADRRRAHAPADLAPARAVRRLHRDLRRRLRAVAGGRQRRSPTSRCWSRSTRSRRRSRAGA